MAKKENIDDFYQQDFGDGFTSKNNPRGTLKNQLQVKVEKDSNSSQGNMSVVEKIRQIKMNLQKLPVQDDDNDENDRFQKNSKIPQSTINKKNPRDEEEEIFVFDNEDRDSKFNSKKVVKYRSQGSQGKDSEAGSAQDELFSQQNQSGQYFNKKDLSERSGDVSVDQNQDEEEEEQGFLFGLREEFDQFPEDFKMNNRISTSNRSLFVTAAITAVQQVAFKPHIFYYFILMILNVSLGTDNSWVFLLFQIFIFITVAPGLWFIIIKQGLQNQYNIDNSEVQVYDYESRTFGVIPRSELKTGDIIVLDKDERAPADVVALFPVNSNEMPLIQFQLSDGSQSKFLMQHLTLNDLQDLYIQVKYNQLPAFSNQKELQLIYNIGKRSMHTLQVELSIYDIISTDLSQNQGAIIGLVFMTSQTIVKSGVASAADLSKKLNFVLTESVHSSLITTILIILSIAFPLGISLYSLGVGSTKFIGHQYINSDWDHIKSEFIGVFLNHLFIYQNILPIVLEVLKPVFVLMARWKYNNDSIQGGIKQKNYSTCHSAQKIDSLSRLKFINYNYKVFNQENLKVCGFFLINKQVDLGPEYTFLSGRAPKDFDVVSHSEAFEALLLSIPQGPLEYKTINYQNYLLKLGASQIFSRDKHKWIILKGKKDLIQYTHMTTFIMDKEEETQIQLFMIPNEDDIEEDEEDEDNKEKEEQQEKEQDEEDINKLQEKAAKHKEQQLLLKTREYIWIVVSNKQSQFVTQNTNLKWIQMEYMIDKNSVFIFSFKIDQDGLNEFTKTTGIKNFKTQNQILNDDYLKFLLKKVAPIGCFAFQEQKQQEMTILMEMNQAMIRQWFFLEKLTHQKIEDDPTLLALKRTTEWTELTGNGEDLNSQINEIRDSFEKKFPNETDPFKNIYTIDQKAITLVINESVLSKGIDEQRMLFKTLLLFPSYIIYVGLTPESKQAVMNCQAQAIEDEYTTIAVGCETQDLVYVHPGSTLVKLIFFFLINHVQVSFNKCESNLFKDFSHFSISNLYSLQSLILIHARKTHIRISYYTIYQIYKSLFMISIEAWFTMFHGYSQMSIFPVSYHFLYQIFFTSLYGLSIYIFYQDPTTLSFRQNGYEFWKCSQQSYYNMQTIGLVLLLSIYQGFVTFFIPAEILQHANDKDGIIQGFYFISLVSYSTLILTATIQPLLLISTINAEQVGSWIMNGVIVLIVLSFSSNPDLATTSDYYVGHLSELVSSLKSLFMIVLLTIINITPLMIVCHYQNMNVETIDEVEEEEKGEIKGFAPPKIDQSTTLDHNSTINNMIDDSKINLKKRK